MNYKKCVDGDIQFDQSSTVLIYVSEEENSAVQLAAQNLKKDMEAVLNCKVMLTHKWKNVNIVIGTIENCSFLTEGIDNGSIFVNELKEKDGSYRWEAYQHQIVNEVLYIIGTNRRGTVFGIYDLCEQLGISPWHFWADVSAKVKKSFILNKDYHKVDWPSVKYRGIFLNDEEELNAWAKQHTADGTIGSETYRHIFDLLLRLKANYIWPAMHVNYFNRDTDNGRLAEEMGIVVGSSHCDMLLRSNQNEWHPWLQSKGYEEVVYDYSITGENRKKIKEYWRESIELNREYEVCYTVGMRGIHDSGFSTVEIDKDISLNEAEKLRKKVELLGNVIKDQRELLKNGGIKKERGEALQIFIPYKEVLPLYDSGLELPEDVTLIWVDDNFGYMRRYPNIEEQSRIGGHGLYYHSSYWAAPTMSYLFINSIPLAHMGNELKKSFESGIKKIWVLNVGALKPVEQDCEFFLKYGWEAGKEKGVTKSAFHFTENWINNNFSGSHGTEAAKLYDIFAQATNVRKVEHMKENAFSQTIYGDEAGRRLQSLEDIFRRGNKILESLPMEEQAAFFQLFLMKIHASYYINHEYYYADRSVLSYERGNMQAADWYVVLSRKMMDYRRKMLLFYNEKMNKGKWNKIMTPEIFPPAPMAMYPPGKPALTIKGSGLKINCWNNEESLTFHTYGKRQKWFELGNQGAGSITYSIEKPEGLEWIKFSEEKGVIQTETRILVTVENPQLHPGWKGNIVIHNHNDNKQIKLPIELEAVPELPKDYKGYVEAENVISIPADGYDRKKEGVTEFDLATSGWLDIPGMGRYEGSAVMAYSRGKSNLVEDIEKNPSLEYEIYLRSSGTFILEIYRFLTLDSKGNVRFGVGIDEEEPFIVDSDIKDEWLGEWKDCVMDNGEKILIDLPLLTAGTHTIKIFIIDNYVTLTKLVIYTNGYARTNLGPVSSFHNQAMSKEYGSEEPQVDWISLDRISEAIYHVKEEELSVPNILYAGRKFWKRDLLYSICEEYSQSAGMKKYTSHLDDEAKNVFFDFGTGNFIEKDKYLAIEAEYALENSEYAYLSKSKDGREVLWSHLQAETNDRTGYAMHVAKAGLLWENPEQAPGMHYKFYINNAGKYCIWLLIRHYDHRSDSCYLSFDGKVQPISDQFSGGNMFTYSTSQVYYWIEVSEIELSVGEHVISILARKSQLRIDRIYLTMGDELPPANEKWVESQRVVLKS